MAALYFFGISGAEPFWVAVSLAIVPAFGMQFGELGVQQSGEQMPWQVNRPFDLKYKYSEQTHGSGVTYNLRKRGSG